MQEEPIPSEVKKEEFRTTSLAEAILTPVGWTSVMESMFFYRY